MGSRRPYGKKFTKRRVIISCLIKYSKLSNKYNELQKDEDSNYCRCWVIDRKIRSIQDRLFNTLPRFVRNSDNNIFIDELADYSLFLSAINGLRMMFSPQSGAGSQSLEMFLHSLVGEYTVKSEKDRRKRSDEEDYNIDSDDYLDKDTKDWYKSDSGICTKETSHWY